MKKALLASLSDLPSVRDSSNMWVKDISGKHANVAALLDWPEDDSDSDADMEPPQLTEVEASGLGMCYSIWKFWGGGGCREDFLLRF